MIILINIHPACARRSTSRTPASSLVRFTGRSWGRRAPSNPKP